MRVELGERVQVESGRWRFNCSDGICQLEGKKVLSKEIDEDDPINWLADQC